MKYFEDEKEDIIEKNSVQVESFNTSPQPWEDGYHVEILILDMLPATTAKEYNEWRQLHEGKAMKAKSMGIKYEMPEPDYKKHGIAFRYIVLKYWDRNESDAKTTLTMSNNEIILPNYSIFGRIQQKPPRDQFAKGYYEPKLGMNQGSNGYPNLGVIPAAPAQVTMDIEYNGEKKKWTYDDINKKDAGMCTTFEKLLTEEQQRREAWNEYIHDFEALKPEKAVNNLNHRLSRKYLACDYDIEQQRWRYSQICTGMVLNLGIKKSKYLEVVPYVWDKEKKRNYFYPLQEIMGEKLWIGPTLLDENIELANKIITKELNSDIPF